MKPVLLLLLAAWSTSASWAGDAVVPEAVTRCINDSTVIKLALAEFYDRGEGLAHRFPNQQEFEGFSAVRAVDGPCRYLYSGAGEFEIDFDEQSLGFGSVVQPRMTAQPQQPYDEKRVIDFACSRGATIESDLKYLPKPCRRDN